MKDKKKQFLNTKLIKKSLIILPLHPEAFSNREKQIKSNKKENSFKKIWKTHKKKGKLKKKILLVLIVKLHMH